MMTRTIWLSFVGVLVAGPQPAYSQAFDYKIFPGSFCQAELASQAGDLQRPGGYIFNMNGLDSLKVTCPIVRDRVPHYGQINELTKIDGGIHLSYTLSLGKPVCNWISEDEWGGQQMLAPTIVDDHGGTSQVSYYWELPPIGPAGKPLMAIDGTYRASLARCLPSPSYTATLLANGTRPTMASRGVNEIKQSVGHF
jgi:hypothetical protein